MQKRLEESRKAHISTTLTTPTTDELDTKIHDLCLCGDDEVPVENEKYVIGWFYSILTSMRLRLSREKMASQWFQWFEDVHTRVYLESDNLSTQEKVKIAILDTGIELSSEQRDIYELDIYGHEREIEYKSWIDEVEEMGDMWKDDVGHGTHLATLLARIAPNAIIHVARVFRDRKPDMGTEPQNVAQVSNVLNRKRYFVL